MGVPRLDAFRYSCLVITFFQTGSGYHFKSSLRLKQTSSGLYVLSLTHHKLWILFLNIRW